MYCDFVLVCWRELVFESLCVCSVFRVLHFEVILCLCVYMCILWVSLCVFCVYRVSSFVCEMETLPKRQFAAFADISSLKNGLYLSQKWSAWLEIFTEVAHHIGESVIKFAKQMGWVNPGRRRSPTFFGYKRATLDPPWGVSRSFFDVNHASITRESFCRGRATIRRQEHSERVVATFFHTFGPSLIIGLKSRRPYAHCVPVPKCDGNLLVTTNNT